MKQLLCWKICFSLVLILQETCVAYIDNISQNDTKYTILKDFEDLLDGMVGSGGLFDGIGSIDVAVWRRNVRTNESKPVFSKALGKSQVKKVAERLVNLKDVLKPSSELSDIAEEELPVSPDIPANINNRNQYRVASITKTFMGSILDYLSRVENLDLDEKISPKYVNLTTLGMAHNWDNPGKSAKYTSRLPHNSSAFIERITFRHLLTHTSGLSRESQKGDLYGYGSSRTSTPPCPPQDSYQDILNCSTSKDLNWRPWTQHIISYMMPACGYSGYKDHSTAYHNCLPGEYYHYSNAGYSILGLAIDSFIYQNKLFGGTLDKTFKNLFKHLPNTVMTWVNFDREQKNRTTNGCNGGLTFNECDQKRALTDYSDRGIKTPPGGVWSTTSDLAKLMFVSHPLTNLPQERTKYDGRSEEDPSHMPLEVFQYGHGWYVAKNFTCLESQKKQLVMAGSWGTVPGFTSYVITNPEGTSDGFQYSVIMLRSYNYNGRLNLGNQARRLLWRLANSDEVSSGEQLSCPVQVYDDHHNGDKIIGGDKPSLSDKLLKGCGILICIIVVLSSYALHSF